VQVISTALSGRRSACRRFQTEVVRADRRPAEQRQGLREMHRLRCGNKDSFQTRIWPGPQNSSRVAWDQPRNEKNPASLKANPGQVVWDGRL
jgi:hypothetical protein